MRGIRIPSKHKRGDPFPASDWNAAVDACEIIANLSTGRGLGMRGGAIVPQKPLSTRFPAHSVLILNDGGSVRPFRPMKITGVVATDDAGIQSRAVLRGRRPESGDAGGLFVIAQQGIPGDAIGPAWSSGICPAWIKSDGAVSTPIPEHADIWPASFDHALKPTDAGNVELLWPRAAMEADVEYMGMIRFTGGGAGATTENVKFDLACQIWDANPADNVHAGPIQARYFSNIVPESNDKTILAHLATPVALAAGNIYAVVLDTTIVTGIAWAFNTQGVWDGADATGIVSRSDIITAPITADFDPTTVTWNTRPAEGAAITEEWARPSARHVNTEPVRDGVQGRYPFTTVPAVDLGGGDPWAGVTAYGFRISFDNVEEVADPPWDWAQSTSNLNVRDATEAGFLAIETTF